MYPADANRSSSCEDFSHVRLKSSEPTLRTLTNIRLYPLIRSQLLCDLCPNLRSYFHTSSASPRQRAHNLASTTCMTWVVYIRLYYANLRNLDEVHMFPKLYNVSEYASMLDMDCQHMRKRFEFKSPIVVIVRWPCDNMGWKGTSLRS